MPVIWFRFVYLVFKYLVCGVMILRSDFGLGWLGGVIFFSFCAPHFILSLCSLCSDLITTFELRFIPSCWEGSDIFIESDI